MVAKATNEPHASPVKLKKTTSKDLYEPWEMTERKKEIETKYVKLIQGRISNKEPIVTLTDVSPSEDTSTTDLTSSMLSSVVSSSSQESVYSRLKDVMQVTFLVCLKRPVAVVSYCQESQIRCYFNRCYFVISTLISSLKFCQKIK